MRNALRTMTMALAAALAWAGNPAPAAAATLDVGPGAAFARIEDAVAKAKPGDTIAVRPRGGGAAYERVALLMRTPGLTIRGLAEPGRHVKIDGTGYDYSGAGSVPRAIVQFDRGADGCVLEGFELTGAHNASHNGAGVRINQANAVTIRNCAIHGNDMGAMSNGALKDKTARAQRFEYCRVFGNGDKAAAGYNHNFYLGGTSVTLHGCEVFAPTTGHNVKSRAHLNLIEYCYIHDSANRELDLVDAQGNTDAPESHSLLLGNVIVKAAPIEGNRTVIHFGQDGGKDHRGTISLIHNTIVTPYIAPVVELSAPGASAELYNNLIWGADANQRNQTLLAARAGARIDGVRGAGNWIDTTFVLPKEAAFEAPAGAKARVEGLLRKGDDGRLLVPAAGKGSPVDGGVTLARIPWKADFSAPNASGGGAKLPELEEYRAPCKVEPRKITGPPDCGAYEAAGTRAR